MVFGLSEVLASLNMRLEKGLAGSRHRNWDFELWSYLGLAVYGLLTACHAGQLNKQGAG